MNKKRYKNLIKKDTLRDIERWTENCSKQKFDDLDEEVCWLDWLCDDIKAAIDECKKEIINNKEKFNIGCDADIEFVDNIYKKFSNVKLNETQYQTTQETPSRFEFRKPCMQTVINEVNSLNS